MRESPPQFENQIIMARVYIKSIMHSTMYQKTPFCLPEMVVVKISSVACWFSPVKIDYSDCQKSFISRINKVFFP